MKTEAGRKEWIIVSTDGKHVYYSDHFEPDDSGNPQLVSFTKIN